MSPRARKILIGAGVGLAVVLVAVLGTATYFYRQATALPEWYDPDAPIAEAEDPTGDLEPLTWEIADEPAPRDEPASPDPDANGTEAAKPPRRSKRVMKNFHLKSVAKDPVLKRATRSSRAEYHDGKLEAGAVLDMGRIDRKSLNGENRKFYDRATKAFPPLRSEQVYLALEDEPISRDGYLQLGKTPRVKIGNLSYSLDGAARRVGMSPRELRREIDRELRRLKVRDPDAPPPPLDDAPIDGPI